MEARIRKLKNNIQSLKSWKTAPLPLLHFTDKSMVTFNLTLIQMDEMHQAWRKQFDICCRKLQQQLCECRGSKICWEKIKDHIISQVCIMNIRWSRFLVWIWKKNKGGAENVKGWKAGSIVATLLWALHYPIHISTEKSGPGEKQEKQNNSKASERKKYVRIDLLNETDYSTGWQSTITQLERHRKRKGRE